MSTLSGIAAKGEKGKPRFRSLDINNLYSPKQGESLEPNQHKNTASRRHGGMQSLGKVPVARRPANLPSLKSEYSGNDPAISLVPSGGTGWGSKPGETGPPPTVTQAPTTSTSTPPIVTPTTSPPATVAATVSTPTFTAPTTSTSVASATIPSQSHGDKSWSSITSSSSENTPMFLAHQSPYFQQQFPSLSGDGNLSGPNKIDPAHLPGPSLRPQNEGNWIQGGGRPQGQMGAGVGSQQGTVPAQGPLSLPHLPQGLDVGNNLGPSGVGGGPAGPMPPSQHFRLMPPFMLKHNMPTGGFPPNYQHGPPRPRFQLTDPRFMHPNRGPLNVEQDEVSSRPIIKEEDLKVMDEIGRDTGWAGHDEIDYNQTLSFSDEEGAQDEEFKGKTGRQFLQNKEKREAEHKLVEMEANFTDNEKLNQEISRESVISTHNEMRDSQHAWQLATSRPSDVRQGVLPPMVNFPPSQARVPGHQGTRQGEDDEVWQEKKRIHHEELAIAVERAKQRKEEEEKRYEESRLAAAKKLQLLEEKMRSKSGFDKEERNISPPLNVNHGSNVLIPEWEKDRSRKNSEERDDKPPKENFDNFRTAQTENRVQNRERENAGQHSFGRQQFSLPPRLQRQAENRPSPYYRQGSGSSPQPPSSGNPQYDMRWQVNQSGPHFGGSTGVSKNYRGHKDSQMSVCEKEDNTRERETGFESREKERLNRPPSRDKNTEGGWKSQGYSAESNIVMNSENEHKHDYSKNKMPVNCLDSDSFSKDKESENDRFQEEKGNDKKSNLSFQDDAFIERGSRDSVQITQDNKLETEMLDSRGSRDDRLIEDSNTHESMLSWADFTYDVEYKEDKRRKDESDTRRDMHTVPPVYQRHIPGPITKEKLEASELKCESTRSLNLVPLTRSEPKTEVKKSENKWDVGNSGDAWQQVPASSAHQPASTEIESQDDTTSQPLSDATQDNTNSCQQDVEDSKKSTPKPLHTERDHLETSGNYKPDVQRSGRGGQRGVRHDSQRSKPWPGSYFRGGSSMWQRDRGPMPPNRRSNVGRDWGHHEPESEASDEVSASTESGKEDRRHDQDRKQFSRSPKRGVRKSDKEIKDSRKQENDKNNYSLGNENRRYDKKLMYENNQMGAGFEPSGVPSRRGRGAFRSKGSSTTLGRGMVDGYGPPTSKKPFSESVASGSQEDKKTEGSQNKEDGANDMSHDEKMKLNQQQLSAGIVANTSRHGNVKSQSQSIPPRLQRKDSERKFRDRRPRESMKSGSGSGGEVEDEDYESTSEHEDRSCGEEKQNEHSRKPYSHGMSTRGNHRRQSSNRNFGRDKNNGSSYEKDHNLRRSGHQSMVNGSSRNQGGKDQMTSEQALGEKKQSRPDYKEKRNNLDRIDLSNTASVVVVDDQPEVTVEEDQRVFATDNNGFQEVRSKKNVKEANRQQKEEPQRWSKEQRPKPNKPPSSQSPGPPGSTALSSGKAICDRTRSDKLAPRFIKLKQQNRQEKITQQQQTHDVSELNKINQSNLPGFPTKDMTNPAPPPPPQVNAWTKPITAALHTTSGLIESCNIEVADHMHSTTSSQRSSPNDDKAVGKQPAEKAMLDGTSPPVQTIIFENTNYKAAPTDVAMKSKYSNQVNKNQRPDKTRDKNMDEDNIAVGFKSPGPDIQMQDTKAESIQMPISFVKNEDSADMKLDFRFDSELSQLTDDKSTKSITSIQMTRSIQMATQSSAADLQFKLASVKKVWENPPTVLEHSGEEANNVAATSSFTPTFGNSVEDPGNYGKPNDPSVGEDGSTPEGVYNSSQQLQNNSNAYNGSSVQNMIKPDPSSNVCKVKPLPQSGMHPHAGPLSPPVGPFASSLAQPSQHMNYQPPPGQYGGIPAIPSPPTVYTQSHEHLYQAIQISNSQMLNRQATSQFSQFTPYMSQGLGQTSGFSQQNMYLAQTAPPPPTGAAAPAHPDLFQTQISQFRIQPPTYGGNQQLNTNPSTMLISSTGMKPPPQPIGAIGSKAASYQPPSQPPSQLLIYSDPQIMNQTQYIPNSQLVQRPPNSVVSAIPPSSASYYSASTGGNAAAYFQPANSNMHHLQPFSTQTPAATPAGMGSFGSLPRVILQNAVQTVVGSRVQSTVHRSNSPAPHRATSSPHINKISQRQPSS